MRHLLFGSERPERNVQKARPRRHALQRTRIVDAKAARQVDVGTPLQQQPMSSDAKDGENAIAAFELKCAKIVVHLCEAATRWNVDFHSDGVEARKMPAKRRAHTSRHRIGR